MSAAFGFWLVKTWETSEVKNSISFNYKFQINDDLEINDDMPKLLLVQVSTKVSQRGYLKFVNEGGGLMAKNMAENMGWQTSRVNKSSLTFPPLLKFLKNFSQPHPILPVLLVSAASRILAAPVTVECSSYNVIQLTTCNRRVIAIHNFTTNKIWCLVIAF